MEEIVQFSLWFQRTSANYDGATWEQAWFQEYEIKRSHLLKDQSIGTLKREQSNNNQTNMIKVHYVDALKCHKGTHSYVY